MKTLELNQEGIDLLWSAVINQESVENILCNAAKDAGEYVYHKNRVVQCRELRDNIRKLGVTNISLK